jgi:hypothetical protein
MTRLSNRQYPMLQSLFENGPDVYMSILEAQRFDQRPFRSMLMRRWAVYRPGKGFHITREGIAAMEEFMTTDIARKNPTLPLTSYFDPTAYGLSIVKKEKRKANAAA